MQSARAHRGPDNLRADAKRRCPSVASVAMLGVYPHAGMTPEDFAGITHYSVRPLRAQA